MNVAQAQPETVVVGGGLVGWASAYGLAKRGMPALVIDAMDEGAATMAGAGIIAPGAHINPPAGYLPLASAAMRHYPRLIAELAELEAGETGFDTVGGLYVARDESGIATVDNVERTLIERRDAGMASIGKVERISGAVARELFPPLLPSVPVAVWFSDGGRVNGRLLREAVRTAAINLGCQQRIGRATVGLRDGRIQIGDPNGTWYVPETVVISGGAWTVDLGRQLGLPLPIEPQKGQILHMTWPDDSTGRWPTLNSEASHYMLAFPEGRIVCGATRETGSGFDTRLTAGGIHTVLSEALAIAPGLADCSFLEARVGLRPWSTDRLPAIGRLPGISNGWICTGHGAGGLTLGPYSGDLVAQMITGAVPEIDPTPYSPNRWPIL
jgi:D-amino-acid dehydrogenase